nr:phosphopantetheine-binding protein [Streptomyces sp. DfronAA-171]
MPDLSAALADEPWTAPTGPVEEALAEIWAEELYGDATKPVGARQSFFRIGGDSARAARVIARVQEEFDVLLPLSAVFERPTVRSLATAVEEAVCVEIATLTEAEQVLAQGEYQP